MPTWHPAPSQELTESLGDVWDALADQVADDPSFEEVVGVSNEDLMKQAMTAVTVLLAQTEHEDVPTTLMHVYAMGFVVGAKYGERRAKRSPD